MNLYFFVLFLLFLCSLVLFIIGLKILNFALNQLSSNKIKQLLLKFTKNDIQTLLLGILVTAIFQSSNAISAITLSFVTAKYLSLHKGLIIIIGSNIGTTLTSVLFSLNVQNYYFLFIILSFFFLFKNRQLSLLTTSIAILLLGLNKMSYYLENLLSIDSFKPILLKFNNSNFICFLVGTLFSFIIQSSSASIGMIQTLHQNKLISLSSSVSFMLGANIGTTITGIIVGFLGNHDARKIAIVNFLFNFIGSICFLFIVRWYSSCLLFLQNIYNLSNSFTISLSHIIYNIVTVLIFFIILVFSKHLKLKIPNIFI